MLTTTALKVKGKKDDAVFFKIIYTIQRFIAPDWLQIVLLSQNYVSSFAK